MRIGVRACIYVASLTCHVTKELPNIMPSKKYPGVLNSPLPPPPALLGAKNYDAAVAEYEQEVQSRLKLLMEHYCIDLENPARWQQLACELAKAHVPGLKPWHASVDTDRHARVLFRMLYMIRVRRFSEKSAAGAVSEVFPDLGDAESIRSIFREQKKRQDLNKIFEMFDRVDAVTGQETIKEALSEEFREDFKRLDQVEKPKSGRPRKK